MKLERKIIRVDGTEEMLPEKIQTFTSLYKMLECNMLEHVNLRNGWSLLVDEEGKLTGKPYNPKATEIAIYVLDRDDYICGPAALVRTRNLG